MDSRTRRLYGLCGSHLRNLASSASVRARLRRTCDAPFGCGVMMPLAEHAWGWRYLFIAQGHAFLRAGRIAEARSVAERALTLAIERGEPPQQGYALKLIGDIAASQGAEGEATEAYRRCAALAESCGMRPLLGACREAEARLAPLAAARAN